jgi:asparagine synthase (glutamine-hydrolysing)
MSAILGLLRRDGRDADTAVLARMSSALAHRGPHGFVTATNGPAGLGHGLLAVAGNGLIVGPNEVMITLDGRLDNRDTLCAQLHQAHDASDASLLLAAYQRWGQDCPSHLLGDFAFAIWDPGQRQLICARDHFGVRPFYYHISGKLFLFASELKAIVREAPALRERLDDEWLGDFVIGLAPAEETTLYSEIRRLAPGHICIVTPAKSEISAYFRLEERAATPKCDRSAEFVEHLRTAIQCRTAGPAPVCAMLSGGLDSSSIVSLASPMLEKRGDRLTTFSLVYPDTPEHDERRYIDEMIKASNVDPIFIDSGKLEPLAHFKDLLDEQDGPFLAPNLAASRQIHRAASSRGFGVILDGHGGDETIAHGGGLLNDLAYSGRWPTLWRELEQYGPIEGVTPARVFFSILLRKGPHRKLAHKARDVIRRVRRGPGAGAPRHLAAARPELAKRARLLERHPDLPTPTSVFGREERYDHHTSITSNFQSYGLEILDHNAAGAGVEVRFPFLDKRLIEFCLSLPAGERMGGGFTRRILRQSLSGVLPRAIRDRPDKLDFTPHIVAGMVSRHGALIEDLLADDCNLGRFVNLPVVRLAWERIRGAVASANGFDVQLVWRVATLGIWLRNG